MNYYNSYVARDDHVPGYVYIFEAEGFHGWLPGCLLKRYKIGLSRNPDARVQRLVDGQPPCDFKIVKTIYVEDMAGVEADLHQRFAGSNVRLEKSREWFDLYPWQLAMLKFHMNRYDSQFVSWADLPFKKIAITLIVVFGLGVVVAVPVLEMVEQNLMTEQKNN